MRLFMVYLKDPSSSFAIFDGIEIIDIAHGEAKSYCFIVSCVPESMK